MTTRPAPNPSPRPRGWPQWPLLRWSRSLRRVVQGLVLRPLVDRYATPLVVRGLDRVPRAPAVFAANHSSHADTAVLLHVLGPHLAGRLVPAAAADYFFSTRLRALLSTLLVGALPFPREGGAGLRRCRTALTAGYSVLLFPQGTRAGGPFRTGIGRLASTGVPVVPIHLDGCGAVLPKGSYRPTPHPVTVTFGAPLDLTGVLPGHAAAHIERAVHALAPTPSSAHRTEESAA